MIVSTTKLRRFAAPFAGLALLAAMGAGLHAQTGEGSWEKIADGVIVTPYVGPAKKIRLEVMTDDIVRVTAAPTDSLALPKSLIVVAGPSGAHFDARESGGVLTLKTAHVTAHVVIRTGAVSFLSADGKEVLAEQGPRKLAPETVQGHNFYAIHQEFNRGTDEAFYGLGQHQYQPLNYNGQDVDLAQHNMDIAMPFLVSSRNYGVLWDNNGITRFGDPKPYQGLSRSKSLTITDADGKPGGLTASYAIDGVVKVKRVETEPNYEFNRDLARWPSSLMDSKTGAEVPHQTVTWEGGIQSDKTGVHRFRLYVSSYVKLYVDGKLMVDAWRQNWNPWYRDFDVTMKAGERHTLRIEWIPNDGYLRLLHADPLPPEERHDLSLSSDVANAMDYYFVSGKNLDGVISGYRQLTGKAVMLPRWAFGFWQSRDRYQTQDELLGVVKAYRQQDVPLDVIVQDWRYWSDPTWGSHVFDKTRYPDPAAMIRSVHDLKAHIMISVWPKFYPSTDNYKELDAAGAIYRHNVELGVKDWVCCLSTYYDPYSKVGQDIYWRQIQEKLGVLDIDAWWLDNDEPDIHSNISVKERQYIMGPTAQGPGAEFYNTYPLEHVGGVYDHWRKTNPDKRTFIFTRSGYGGIQRYSAAVWSGDITARWSDMHDQIAAGLNMGLSGMPNWTFDAGGYVMEQKYVHPTPADLAEWQELNTRWIEFAAFVPIFRVHGHADPGDGRPREFYNIAPVGSEDYNAMVEADRLRYRLLPYIYTLEGDTYQRDYTMMRALVMDFPDDPKVRNDGDAYLFGPDFLVAPVTRYQSREQAVYLPAGVTWYDFYNGKTFTGGQTVTVSAPLNHMPLFVKAGAIIPVGPKVQYAAQDVNGSITLYVYTGADGHFSLYEDDGVSYGYEKGAFSRIPIRYDDASGTLSIGARSGSFPGMKQSRSIAVRWISGPSADAANFDTAPDRTVTYTGKALTIRCKD
jgi:alpha-D-xyloside xylohydrolase